MDRTSKRVKQIRFDGIRMPPKIKQKIVKIIGISLFVAASAAAFPVSAQDGLERLFQRALLATTCEEIPNNGRRCVYKFDDFLEISIKDVGGSDTVIAFNNSNVKNPFYASMYFGCIAIIPGLTYGEKYDLSYNVFISPVNGQVYKTLSQCRNFSKQGASIFKD